MNAGILSRIVMEFVDASSRRHEAIRSGDKVKETKYRRCLSPWYLHAMSNPFRYFNSSPEVIRLVVMMYAR